MDPSAIPDDGPLVVVSPHLDDAVLGCGQLLATHPRSVVITALAGQPPAGHGLTAWDAVAGFAPGDDVVGRRHIEDSAALRALVARPVWLPFRDTQYGCSPTEETLASALERAILASDTSAVFLPLGLFHPDHVLVHEAGLRVLRRCTYLRWFGYEEPMYRRVPHVLDDRLRALAHADIAADPAGLSSEGGAQEKRRAVSMYQSQVRALKAQWRHEYHDAFAPESYWRLTVTPATVTIRGRDG